MQVVDSNVVINTIESNTNANFTASARACGDSDSNIVKDIRLDTLSVQLSNGASIHAHSAGSLLLPNLPTPLKVYIFRDKDLSLSLLSVSELCKAGWLVHFTDNKFIATYNGCVSLGGNRYSAANTLTDILPSSR